MTSWRSLPPLSALRAFAAFVDTGSVTRAGAELNVSHAAISQQLRTLETHLGLALFDRRGRELALTAEGRLLAEAATVGFDGIAKVVEVLTGAEAGRPLQITTTPSFAAGWLMPRLADFRAHHPEIDIAIDPSGALRTSARAATTSACVSAVERGPGSIPGCSSYPASWWWRRRRWSARRRLQI
jgi:LysR family glycine cleavage system transcriptional activator